MAFSEARSICQGVVSCWSGLPATPYRCQALSIAEDVRFGTNVALEIASKWCRRRAELMGGGARGVEVGDVGDVEGTLYCGSKEAEG